MADLHHLLAIYVHAHRIGNSVPPRIDAEARAALAAEPPAPDPREALAARPLLEAVARLGDRIGQHTVAEITTISDRAAAWLAENPPGQPVAIEPRGCPTPGACSCVEPPAPAPAADGEREELAQWLEREAECASRHGMTNIDDDDDLRRAAALLRQPAPAPVPADLTPVAYDATAGVRIELTRATPCPLWAVRYGSERMSIHGEWSVEPMPSSRTADWIALHSFPSPAAALAELQRYRKAAASVDGPQPPQGGEVADA